MVCSVRSYLPAFGHYTLHSCGFGCCKTYGTVLYHHTTAKVEKSMSFDSTSVMIGGSKSERRKEWLKFRDQHQSLSVFIIA